MNRQYDEIYPLFGHRHAGGADRYEGQDPTRDEHAGGRCSRWFGVTIFDFQRCAPVGGRTSGFPSHWRAMGRYCEAIERVGGGESSDVDRCICSGVYGEHTRAEYVGFRGVPGGMKFVFRPKGYELPDSAGANCQLVKV